MSEEDIDCQWAGEAGQESTVGQGVQRGQVYSKRIEKSWRAVIKRVMRSSLHF